MSFGKFALVLGLVLLGILPQARASFVCEVALGSSAEVAAYTIHALYGIESQSDPYRLDKRIQAEDLFSGHMIFDSHHPHPNPTHSFLASNETNLYHGEMDLSPTDIVVGYGGNVGWDIAVRKNASTLIVSDWSIIPLLVQMHLYRPLLLAAKTRAEFLSFLSYRPAAESDDLGEIFESILKPMPDEKLKLAQEKIHNRLLEDPALNDPTSKLFVSNYLSVRNGGDSFFEMLALKLKWSKIFESFNYRYNPKVLISDGAKPEVVNHPLYSFLSSEMAFQRLKKIFQEGLLFSHAHYDNPDQMSAVLEMGLLLESPRVTYALTNIIDVASGGDRDRGGLAFQKFLNSAIEIHGEGVLDVHVTRNLGEPFGFEHHVVPAASVIPALVDDYVYGSNKGGTSPVRIGRSPRQSP